MPNTRLMSLDAYNGSLDTLATAPIRRADFTVDATGEVRFALGAGEDNASTTARPTSTAMAIPVLAPAVQSRDPAWGATGEGEAS